MARVNEGSHTHTLYPQPWSITRFG